MPKSDGRFEKGTHWRKPKPHWNKDWLFEEYINKARSSSEIAQQNGCKENNIHYWLKKHGIAARSVSEARSIKYWGTSGELNPMHGRTGDKNPRYIDGGSPERQRMYSRGEGREFLASILKRDRYLCQRCGAKNTGKKSMHVHHIKPWAGNRELRFDRGNVITLCRNCHNWVHSKANTNLEFLA